MLGVGCALGVAGMECRGNGNPVELFGRGGECFPKRFEIFAEISPTFSNSILYSQLPPILQSPHPILSTIWRSSVEFFGNPAHRHRRLLSPTDHALHFSQLYSKATHQSPRTLHLLKLRADRSQRALQVAGLAEQTDIQIIWIIFVPGGGP